MKFRSSAGHQAARVGEESPSTRLYNGLCPEAPRSDTYLTKALMNEKFKENFSLEELLLLESLWFQMYPSLQKMAMVEYTIDLYIIA